MSSRVLAATLVAAFGVVAHKEYTGGAWPPRPFRFWGVVVVWMMLAVVASVAPELAAAFSVAAVLGVYFGAIPGTGGASSAKSPTQAQINQASAQNAAGAAQPGGTHPGTSNVPS